MMKINKLLIKMRKKLSRFQFKKVKPHEGVNKNNIKIEFGSRISEDSVIGDYTYVGYYCAIYKAKIGRYCSIADFVSIGPSEHPIPNISTSGIFYPDWLNTVLEKDVILGNDVWVGVDTIIRRGVTIGNGTIIGANSFVNKDIPDFAIAAGSPARVIGYRFNEEIRNEILDAKWWEFDVTRARDIIADIERKYETYFSTN
jgi:acetyltransferase-like isoleucine patch superfamily enzyme